MEDLKNLMSVDEVTGLHVCCSYELGKLSCIFDPKLAEDYAAIIFQFFLYCLRGITANVTFRFSKIRKA